MPSLVELYHRFKDRGFTILAIDIKESPKTVKKYAKKAGIPFPILMDPKGRVARGYGIRGTPAHYLITQKGDIIGFAMGFKNWKNKKSHDLIQLLIDQNSEK